MIDLSSFSNMFPSLASFFDSETLNALSSVRPQASQPEPVDEDEAQDQVELSEPARRLLPAVTPGSSYDSPAPSEPIAVAEDGTYQPAQTSQRLGMSMGFEFNLSIQRQVTAVTRDAHVDRPSAAAARLTALKSRSLYYQSSLNESRGLLAGGYTESRSLQTELFYSRTREISLSLPASRSEQFDRTSAQVSRSFQLDISMDFSFLGQFTSQSNTISSLDDDLFGQYLDNTGGLSRHALQSFFDDVDQILADSEAFVVESLGSFFGQVAEQFGLTADEAVMLEDTVLNEVASFFDEIGTFLEESNAMLAGPSDVSEQPQVPATASEPASAEPADTAVDPLNDEEEDPAAFLA